MSQYTADPRAEELQLLRQLYAWPRPRLFSSHSATIAIAARLDKKGELVLMAWNFGQDVRSEWAIEITAAGRRAIGVPSSAKTEGLGSEANA